MIFPVFTQIRENGRKAVCFSNLRQLGIAFQLYKSDYEGVYPEAGEYVYASPAGWVYCTAQWRIHVRRGVLFSYVGEERIYRCPSAALPLAMTMNARFSMLAEERVRDAAGTILLLEEDAASVGRQGPNDGVFFPERVVDLLTERHQGGGLLLFADGHGAWRHGSRRWDLEQFAP